MAQSALHCKVKTNTETKVFQKKLLNDNNIKYIRLNKKCVLLKQMYSMPVKVVCQ